MLLLSSSSYTHSLSLFPFECVRIFYVIFLYISSWTLGPSRLFLLIRTINFLEPILNYFLLNLWKLLSLVCYLKLWPYFISFDFIKPNAELQFLKSQNSSFLKMKTFLNFFTIFYFIRWFKPLYVDYFDICKPQKLVAVEKWFSHFLHPQRFDFHVVNSFVRIL